MIIDRPGTTSFGSFTIMFSCKLIFLSVILSFHLTLINGQFGGFGVPFLNAGGSQAGFNNQNTNFNSHRGGSFGVIAGFGSGGQSTNFNQQNSGGGNRPIKH